MSNGDGENRREYEKPSRLSERKLGGNEFAQAIARMAVAQICEGEGFQSFQQSALDALSDVAVRYIVHVGKTAHLYANLAGRTECNFFDVVQGLEDLGSGQGFSGASDVDHRPEDSGVIRDVIQYVGIAEETPFAYSLPQFPFIKDNKPKPSFLQSGIEPPDEHIPPWLPAFPEHHTFEQPSHPNENLTSYQVKDSRQEKQYGNVERPSMNLHISRASNGEGPLSFDHGDAAFIGKQVAESNPFLAPPLQPGEKDVSPVPLPAKFSNEETIGAGEVQNSFVSNHVSALEIFAPAIEAVKSGICESEEQQKKGQLRQRPLVQFKIGVGKKSLGEAHGVRLRDKAFETFSSWFVDDNEMDDKKKRAEAILRKSMENKGELA